MTHAEEVKRRRRRSKKRRKGKGCNEESEGQRREDKSTRFQKRTRRKRWREKWRDGVGDATV
jgi:hypothetical protein